MYLHPPFFKIKNAQPKLRNKTQTQLSPNNVNNA